MGYNFPNAPTVGQAYGNYVWDSEKWQLPKGVTPDRATIYAAPFDALAYNGMQINGSMNVSQENGANGISVANAAKNIIDGWVLQSGGPQVVVGQQIPGGPAGFSNILQAYNTTINAAPTGTDHCFFYTPIEGYRVARLGWGAANASPITIAFWVFSTKIGTFSGVVRNSAANRGYVFTYTINAAGTWEYKVITIPGDTTGTWEKTNLKGMIVGLALLSGTTYATATPNTWISSDVWALIGTQNVVNAGDFIQFTGFVVLPGIEAPSAARSPLIMRPFDQELITCKRYLDFADGFIGTSFGTSSGHVTGRIRMRSQPTLLLKNGTNAIVEMGVGSFTITSVGAWSGGSESGGFDVTGGSFSAAFHSIEMSSTKAVMLDARP